MPESIPFRYFVTGLEEEVGENSQAWLEPLPSGLSDDELGRPGYPTYGDYFQAISYFIVSSEYSCLDFLSPAAICSVNIHLEKHGAYYHPGRINVQYRDGKSRNFVVNLAVNEFARKTAVKEFEILRLLKDKDAGQYLPSVYGFAETQTTSGSLLSMFTGEWIDDFHEFHFSGDNRKVVVWAPDNHFFLSREQACEAYRQAAGILTGFYDPVNFNQIYPWHHAAGDFVISVAESGAVDIRLITARQYAPLFHFDDEESMENRIVGLLYFFLNMSIRMRLDRLDGIGDYIWSDMFVLESSVRGFTDMAGNLDLGGMNGLDAIEACVNVFSEDTFYDMAQEMVAMHNQAAPEIKVIIANLEEHARTAYRLFAEHFNTI